MTVVQFNLRVPKELKDQVDEAAQVSGRSINAEAAYRLEQSFAAEDSQKSDSMNIVVDTSWFADAGVTKEDVGNFIKYVVESRATKYEVDKDD